MRRAFQGTCLLAVLLIVPARAADEEENPILAYVKTRVKDQKKPFTLVIRLTVKEGSAAKFEETFAKAAKATRAEKGCIEYGAAVDADPSLPVQTKYGPETFVVVEKWDSLDALKAHAAAPHMAAYGAKTKELLASRVIHILSPA